MHRFSRLSAAFALLVAATLLLWQTPGAPAADQKPKEAPKEKVVDFARDITPIFKANCTKCHQEARAGGPGGGGGRPGGPGGGGPGGGPGGGGPGRGPGGGLRLDDKGAALKGGKAGNDIVPGKAEDSLLVKLLSGPVTVG